MAPSHKSLEQALLRYRAEAFTDDDVAGCTGLPPRSTRELIKCGAIRTRSEKRGAGYIRTFDATTFKRVAIVAALNNAGFSLKLAGQIAYLLPSDNVLYELYDPIYVLCDTTASVDRNELPPRLAAPKFDWFDADKPASGDPQNDWLLEIYDGRFVAVVFQHLSRVLIYGDLRIAGAAFVSWWPFQAQIDPEFWSGADVRPRWEGRRLADRINPKFLDYKYERHDARKDPLMVKALAAARRPIFKTTINMTLAIQLALRRYLGLDPLLTDEAGS